MEIGRKIYYEKATGAIIVDTGERAGSVVETSQDQDFEMYVPLTNRIPITVGCLQLDYGQYRQEFEKCNGYRVNVKNGKLEFSYSDY